jgi:hypothetical protein
VITSVITSLGVLLGVAFTAFGLIYAPAAADRRRRALTTALVLTTNGDGLLDLSQTRFPRIGLPQ